MLSGAPRAPRPKGSRYDDQIAILGESFQQAGSSRPWSATCQAVADMKVFLVGLGAKSAK